MSYDDYWNGPPELAVMYRKEFELKTQRRNQEMWLQGRYIYDALLAASPLFRTQFKKGKIEPLPYDKEPYPVTEADVKQLEEKRRKQEEEKLRAQFAAFAKSLKDRRETNGNNR